MTLDLDKMKYLNKNTRKRRKKYHPDQTAFFYFDANKSLEEFVDSEKDPQQTRKKILNKHKGLKFDWAQIDKAPGPVFNYNVTDKERIKYAEVLKRTPSNPERKKLSKILGLEFTRVYTAYRRRLQIAAGKAPSYQVHIKERRHSKMAGELCLLKGIEPVVLLEYWHENIRHFAGVDTDFVPLTFCASANNVETVVKKGFAKDKKRDTLQKKGSSFSDVVQLEPMLRKKLERAGFDMTTYSDRYLLSVQRMAKNIARGHNMFVPKELREMARWIAEHVYANKT